MNYSTYPIKELERLGYHYQYIREHIDSFTHSVKKAYGFRTDKMTRPLIIANMVQIVRDNVDLINDTDTLEEMLTFVRNEKGRPEAQNGSHDDLIMALCIAHYCRSQAKLTIDKQTILLPDTLPEDVRQDLEDDPAMMQLYLQQNGLI
jgi:phage terminase large subunit